MIGCDDHNLTRFLDKLLPRLVIIFVGGLLIAQAALFVDGTRGYISKTDKLEGEQLAIRPPGETGTVRAALEPLQRLRLGRSLLLRVVSEESRPDIAVLINNREAGSFRNGAVRLMVYEQDYLEIDARNWPHPVRFRVETDDGILLPLHGVEFETDGDTLAVGRVKLK
ncbi:MAG: hypothetical protein E6X17_15730 [Sporomusaceae bacterium]|nr:hypothetical protein [Sporomusaceae bacterium]